MTHSNGNISDPVTLTEFKSIIDTLQFEKEHGQMKTRNIIRSPSHRRRLWLALSVSVVAMVSGEWFR